MNKMIRLFVVFSILNLSIVSPLFGGTIRGGTSIQLEMVETLDSETAFVGKQVTFKVLSRVVSLDGEVLIEKGAIALGRVTKTKASNYGGMPGNLSVTLSNVEAVDGSQVPITAVSVRKGTDNMVWSLGLAWFLLCLPALLIKGGDAELQAGSIIIATVSGNTDIQI